MAPAGGGVASALERSAARGCPDDLDDPQRVERYLASLHLDDLALASACAAGSEAAWDHFILTFRPVLYRAADAIDRTGAARELADEIYGELFGTTVRDSERRSLLHYFHGRSTLAIWLRAVLAQRHVDAHRRQSRLRPLPDDTDTLSIPSTPVLPSAARERAALFRALRSVVCALPPRDRLRLKSYYVQQLTLAQIGVALREHEATVSRHLARVRRTIRADVMTVLREREEMSEGEIEECLAASLQDPGTLDVVRLLADEQYVGATADAEAMPGASKKMPQDRSE